MDQAQVCTTILSILLQPQCPKVSTTPLRQWGLRQYLPFSWTTLRGKHCRHPIAVMGVVDTFGQYVLAYSCLSESSFFHPLGKF